MANSVPASSIFHVPATDSLILAKPLSNSQIFKAGNPVLVTEPSHPPAEISPFTAFLISGACSLKIMKHMVSEFLNCLLTVSSPPEPRRGRLANQKNGSGGRSRRPLIRHRGKKVGTGIKGLV